MPRTYLLVSLALASVYGCATVSKESPTALKEADASIKTAKHNDVEDYMPRALEGAERKLDESVKLMKQSKQDEALRQAAQAKAIADGATNLVRDMNAFDQNSGQFLADQATKDKNALAQVDALKGQLAQLQAENAKLKADNQSLANKPAQIEKEIPADFRVGKTVAYFSTGSTVLSSRYRDDVEQLAGLLKANPTLAVKLEGFADARGSAELNQKLAEKRLQAVADLLKQQGVDEKRMQLVTVGATGDRKEARASHQGELQLDRRVTATLTSTAH